MKNLEDDLYELQSVRQEDFGDRIRELEKENSVLKNSNQNELNIKVLQLETTIIDLQNQLHVKDKKISKFEVEQEQLKLEVEKHTD